MTVPHPFLSGPAMHRMAEADKNRWGLFLSGTASTHMATADRNALGRVR